MPDHDHTIGGPCCPHCNDPDGRILIHRSICFPAHDKYICTKCGKKSYRYEGTKYEREDDPRS